MNQTQKGCSRREKPPPVLGGQRQIEEAIEQRMRLGEAVGGCLSYADGYTDAVAEAEEIGPDALRAFLDSTRDHGFFRKKRFLRVVNVGYSGSQIARNNDRANAKGLASHLSKKQWTHIVFAFSGRCVYCGEAPRTVTIDHLVPICKGGGTEPMNVVPSCFECNIKKGRKLPEEFVSRERLTEIVATLTEANRCF